VKKKVCGDLSCHQMLSKIQFVTIFLDLVSTSDDELYWKLKFTLIVITFIIFVLIIFFALLYYCRQCTTTSPDVPSRPKTPQPSDNQLTEAPVMIFNDQIDISGYWNPEVTVENECESVQVQVHALESAEVPNELNIRKRFFYMFIRLLT
jgi:heme/copper-type cytochrome/quinol oxidase subunit 2